MKKTKFPENTPDERYPAERMAHWNGIARNRDSLPGLGGCYHRQLREQYRFLIPEGSRVLEIGCAEGDLLAALRPAYGVGLDLSPEMLVMARKRHPHLLFVQADICAPELDAALDIRESESFEQPFDAIILSDLVNDIWDALAMFKNLRRFCDQNTRIVLNFHSHLWEHPFQMLQRSGRVTSRLKQNWFTPEDTENLLGLAGFEVIRTFEAVLWPFATPLLERLCNRWLVKLWPFSIFAMTHFQVCRPASPPPKKRPVWCLWLFPRATKLATLRTPCSAPRKWARARRSFLWKAIPRTTPGNPSPKPLPGTPNAVAKRCANPARARAMPCGQGLPLPKATS